jgi:hypothetical protein
MADQKKPSQRNDGPQRTPNGPTNPGGNWLSRGWFWIVLIILLVIGSRYLFNGPTEATNLVGLDRVAAAVQGDRVESIVIQGESVTVTLKDGSRLYTRKETAESLLDTLSRLGVSAAQLEALPVRSAIFSWLMMLLPMLLIFGFFIFIMRQAGGGGQNRALQFGRSRARKMEGADRPTVTFADVAGSDEAKQELAEVVEFLKEPQKFAALGARIPKGVLMVGAPGTGKTLLAKAVAGEAGVPFFHISGSEFVEMFVGVGASRVRDLFEQAKKHSPCIIFVDEIDAVGRHRGAGMGGGTTSASRRSTRFWWRWTASTPTPTSSSSPPPTGPTSSTRRCCGPAASTARSWSTALTAAGAKQFSTCMRAASRWRRTSTWVSLRRRPRAWWAPTWRTWSTKPPSWPRGATNAPSP